MSNKCNSLLKWFIPSYNRTKKDFETVMGTFHTALEDLSLLAEEKVKDVENIESKILELVGEKAEAKLEKLKSEKALKFFEGLSSISNLTTDDIDN